MNCGQHASQRLQHFQSQAGPRSNVLDLKRQSDPAPAENVHPPQASPESNPAKSLHGMPDRNSRTSATTSGGTRAGSTSEATPDNETPEEDSRRAAQTELDRHVETEAAHAASIYSPQEAPAQPTPDPAPVTHMEPHRVYPLKTDSSMEYDDPIETDQYAEAYTHPFAGTLPVEPPARTSRRRGWLRNLSLPNPFAQNMARVGAAVLCIVLLTGYVTYLNYPNIAVRVAASRANMNASIPEYVPKGYDFNGPVAYGQGRLTITFSDQNKSISLSQSRTQWDSRSLLENYINRRTSNYETYRQNGLTIYTYNNRHAAWVNGGTMYTIDSDEYLSQQDIVNMASSL